MYLLPALFLLTPFGQFSTSVALGTAVVAAEESDAAIKQAAKEKQWKKVVALVEAVPAEKRSHRQNAYRAVALMWLKRHDDALEAANLVLKNEPTSTVGLTVRGRSLYSKKSYLEAARDFKKLHERQPANTEFLEKFAHCAYHAKRFDKAAELYAKAYKLKPDSELVSRRLCASMKELKNWSGIVKFVEMLPAEQATLSLQVYAATAHWNQGQKSQAISTTLKMVSSKVADPKFSLKERIDHYLEMFQLARQKELGVHVLGVIMHLVWKDAERIKTLDSVEKTLTSVAEKSSQPFDHFLLGYVQFRGRFSSSKSRAATNKTVVNAVANFRKAASLNRNSDLYQRWLANSLVRLGVMYRLGYFEGKTDKDAIASWEQALEASVKALSLLDHVDNWRAKASALDELGDLEGPNQKRFQKQELECLQEITRKYPQERFPWTRLALIYEFGKEGVVGTPNRPRALSCIRKALEIEPGSVYLLKRSAGLNFDLKRFQQSRKDIDRAITEAKKKAADNKKSSPTDILSAEYMPALYLESAKIAAHVGDKSRFSRDIDAAIMRLPEGRDLFISRTLTLALEKFGATFAFGACRTILAHKQLGENKRVQASVISWRADTRFKQAFAVNFDRDKVSLAQDDYRKVKALSNVGLSVESKIAFCDALKGRPITASKALTAIVDKANYVSTKCEALYYLAFAHVRAKNDDKAKEVMIELGKIYATTYHTQFEEAYLDYNGQKSNLKVSKEVFIEPKIWELWKEHALSKVRGGLEMVRLRRTVVGEISDFHSDRGWESVRRASRASTGVNALLANAKSEFSKTLERMKAGFIMIDEGEARVGLAAVEILKKDYRQALKILDEFIGRWNKVLKVEGGNVQMQQTTHHSLVWALGLRCLARKKSSQKQELYDDREIMRKLRASIEKLKDDKDASHALRRSLKQQWDPPGFDGLYEQAKTFF